MNCKFFWLFVVIFLIISITPVSASLSSQDSMDLGDYADTPISDNFKDGLGDYASKVEIQDNGENLDNINDDLDFDNDSKDNAVLSVEDNVSSVSGFDNKGNCDSKEDSGAWGWVCDNPGKTAAIAVGVVVIAAAVVLVSAIGFLSFFKGFKTNSLSTKGLDVKSVVKGGGSVVSVSKPVSEVVLSSVEQVKVSFVDSIEKPVFTGDKIFNVIDTAVGQAKSSGVVSKSVGDISINNGLNGKSSIHVLSEAELNRNLRLDAIVARMKQGNPLGEVKQSYLKPKVKWGSNLDQGLNRFIPEITSTSNSPKGLTVSGYSGGLKVNYASQGSQVTTVMDPVVKQLHLKALRPVETISKTFPSIFSDNIASGKSLNLKIMNLNSPVTINSFNYIIEQNNIFNNLFNVNMVKYGVINGNFVNIQLKNSISGLESFKEDIIWDKFHYLDLKSVEQFSSQLYNVNGFKYEKQLNQKTNIGLNPPELHLDPFGFVGLDLNLPNAVKNLELMDEAEINNYARFIHDKLLLTLEIYGMPIYGDYTYSVPVGDVVEYSEKTGDKIASKLEKFEDLTKTNSQEEIKTPEKAGIPETVNTPCNGVVKQMGSKFKDYKSLSCKRKVKKVDNNKVDLLSQHASHILVKRGLQACGNINGLIARNKPVGDVAIPVSGDQEFIGGLEYFMSDNLDSCFDLKVLGMVFESIGAVSSLLSSLGYFQVKSSAGGVETGNGIQNTQQGVNVPQQGGVQQNIHSSQQSTQTVNVPNQQSNAPQQGVNHQINLQPLTSLQTNNRFGDNRLQSNSPIQDSEYVNLLKKFENKKDVYNFLIRVIKEINALKSDEYNQETVLELLSQESSIISLIPMDQQLHFRLIYNDLLLEQSNLLDRMLQRNQPLVRTAQHEQTLNVHRQVFYQQNQVINNPIRQIPYVNAQLSTNAHINNQQSAQEPLVQHQGRQFLNQQLGLQEFRNQIISKIKRNFLIIKQLYSQLIQKLNENLYHEVKSILEEENINLMYYPNLLNLENKQNDILNKLNILKYSVEITPNQIQNPEQTLPPIREILGEFFSNSIQQPQFLQYTSIDLTLNSIRQPQENIRLYLLSFEEKNKHEIEEIIKFYRDRTNLELATIERGYDYIGDGCLNANANEIVEVEEYILYLRFKLSALELCSAQYNYTINSCRENKEKYIKLRIKYEKLLYKLKLGKDAQHLEKLISINQLDQLIRTTDLNLLNELFWTDYKDSGLLDRLNGSKIINKLKNWKT
ncbi:MAG: hypothetical protein CVV28_01035 [Methanobacteriales archaeon HGW-Methanobacteriales-1]|jgi:hypothetical protein|nr:MAG: hypothetical protein CVV28_01035 [Methanobacteriales archaeon HGW-Methanobacteriales-1]